MLLFFLKDRNGHTQKVNQYQYVLVRQNFKNTGFSEWGGRSAPPHKE